MLALPRNVHGQAHITSANSFTNTRALLYDCSLQESLVLSKKLRLPAQKTQRETPICIAVEVLRQRSIRFVYTPAHWQWPMPLLVLTLRIYIYCTMGLANNVSSFSPRCGYRPPLESQASTSSSSQSNGRSNNQQTRIMREQQIHRQRQQHATQPPYNGQAEARGLQQQQQERRYTSIQPVVSNLGSFSNSSIVSVATPQQPQDSVPQQSSIRSIIEQAFAEVGIQYQQEQNIYHFACRGRHGNYQFRLDVRTTERTLLLYATSPLRVPPAHLQGACECVTRANFGLLVGNLELNMDDGEVRFKCSVCLTQTGVLTKMMVKHMFGVALAMMERYFPAIMAVIYGNKDPAVAVRECEQEQ
jgi:hypothetical protein